MDASHPHHVTDEPDKLGRDTGDKVMVFVWVLMLAFTIAALGVSAHGWTHREDYPLPTQVTPASLMTQPNAVWLQ